jgi:hypothetical protein
MNRNWNRRAVGRLPIFSAALLSAVGLVCTGVGSSAHAQSNEVIVNYDVLNGLPASPPAYPQAGGAAAVPPYAPYGTQPPMAAGGQLTPPPAGELSSVLTMIGPDGRPVAPVKLKKPGSQDSSNTQVASTPPAAPAPLPETVPMPTGTPQPPEPGVNAESAPPAAAVQTSEPTAPTVQTPAASNAEPPAPAAPAVEAPTQQPAQEPAAQQQPVQDQPVPQQQAAAEPAQQPAQPPAGQEPAAEQQAAKTPPVPAEGDAAKTEPTEQKPAEEAAAPPEPDNSQPAPPVPQGGIRIVYPTDMNDVPPEANAALDDLASQMQADENMRVEIRCYGSGTPDTENKARRKALARCLSIRQYLFSKDIRTTRMDVRALGLKSEGQPADRVDIVPANS